MISNKCERKVTIPLHFYFKRKE